VSSISLIDGALVRRRRSELGISVRTISAICGVTAPIITRIESGANHSEMSLDLLYKLAGALALDPAQLLLPPPGVSSADPRPDDVVQLGALLYSSERMISISALAELLSWPQSRVKVAADTLDTKLRSCGLRLHRSSPNLGIRSDVDAVNPRVITAALRRHLARDSVGLGEARMLRRIADGDPPRVPSHHDNVQIAVLLKADLVKPGIGTKNRGAPLELTPDVRYSLLLEGSLPTGAA
jgi:transcriptional regulator with XRE-family HTH domain